SSTAFGGEASRAIDGNTDGNYGSNSVTHTSSEADSFWQVDLQVTAEISAVVLYNRADCCTSRLGNLRLSVLDS
ncbi:MAG: hypothetical protein GWO24_37115, partial [Akkermansiaceae bacterium]|nr:hypothetical protein [Akkermansiaceae bacterium]